MRSLAYRQMALDLGPADHFDTVHGGHGERVKVIENGDFSRTATYSHQDARNVVVGAVGKFDCYISQNGFGPTNQKVHLKALTSLWVDLDFYHVPGLGDLSAEQLYRIIERDETWLPGPTMLLNSGRGAYLQWVLTKPLTPDKLPQWQEVEEAIVELLSKYGSDPKCKDASRILRSVGSVNSKTDSSVWARKIYDPMSFARFSKIVLDEHKRQFPPQPQAQPTPRKTRKSSTNNVRQLRTWRTLAHSRMLDIEDLAAMRGPVRDHRKTFAFHFASNAAYFCSEKEQIVRELDGLIEHFENAEYYRRDLPTRLGSVYRLFEKGQYYRFSNKQILSDLRITKEEQRFMRTLVSIDEKRRRYNEKRLDTRQADSRAKKAAKDALRQRARDLYQARMTQTEIARELKVNQATISRWLK